MFPTIRELNRADSKRMRGILLKMIGDLDIKELATIISSAASAETDEEEERAGIGVAAFCIDALRTALPHIEEDIEGWFASLCGITVEELGALPLDADLKILDQIGARPEAADFFTQLLAFAKRMIGLKAKLEGAKKK